MTEGTSARSSRIETVQRLWHAWNTGVHDGVLGLLCEDAIVRPLELTVRSFQGREQLDTLRTDLERLGIRVLSTPFAWEERGDCVIVTGRARIVRRGSADEVDVAWLFGFRGAQVELIQSFFSHEEAVAFADGRARDRAAGAS